jgi:hypothetical protein
MKFFQNPVTQTQIGAVNALMFLVKHVNAQTTESNSSPSRDSSRDIALGVVIGVGLLACCAYYCCRSTPEVDDETRTMQAFVRMRASDPNP